MRRNSLAHRTALAFALLSFLAHARSAEQKIPEIERGLLDSANRERSTRELPILKWDEALAGAARKHAELMAEHNLLLHRLPGEPDLATRAQDAGASFSHISENIAMGEYASGFHDGWMHSPGHRANILDAGVDSVGIAVVEGGEHLFAVEDFALAVEPLSVEDQEKRVAALLAARGLRLIKIGDDARQSCELERDFVGRSKPRYIAHYETAKISELPESLEKEIQSRRYKSAAIGACSPRQLSGSGRFRIVVLLY